MSAITKVLNKSLSIGCQVVGFFLLLCISGCSVNASSARPAEEGGGAERHVVPEVVTRDRELEKQGDGRLTNLLPQYLPKC